MAKNIVHKPGLELDLVCSDPTTPASGDPVRCGNVTGLALTDERSDGKTTVDIGGFVADLSVKAVDGSGNSAVALYDPLWYVDADTPKLSKKATGYFYGFALETIASGETDTINVWHPPAMGTGTLAAGSIGTTQLANNGVTAGKLTATMATGFIPLPLAAAREIASNDIAALAAHGGILASDSTPILKRTNGATDKKLYVEWAASNSDEIAWDFVYPPDLDDSAVVTVHLLAKMDGATDTPTIAVSYFEGIGDSNAGGNTAALSDTLAEVTVEIAAAAVGAAPTGASVGIVPGAHTTDKVQLLGAWIEYTRK
ncbi:MAG: DUF2190 family protein [Anaerolineaceae bacterium]|nr:MAG: DUF2190 family protein [Anaerolineaceae bacterium]